MVLVPPRSPAPGPSTGTQRTFAPTLGSLGARPWQQSTQEPQPLPYLKQQGRNAYDIALEVALRPEPATQPTTICRTNFRGMYWRP